MIFQCAVFFLSFALLKIEHCFRWLLHSLDAITSAFHLMWRSPLAMENLIERKIQQFKNPLILALLSLNQTQQLSNM